VVRGTTVGCTLYLLHATTDVEASMIVEITRAADLIDSLPGGHQDVSDDLRALIPLKIFIVTKYSWDRLEIKEAYTTLEGAMAAYPGEWVIFDNYWATFREDHEYQITVCPLQV
jgi:hypothetical protein